MPAMLLCASHTPLMHENAIDAAVAAQVKGKFAELAAKVRAYAPDLVVQFSPDHLNGFFYDLMPSFCVGTAARSIGDWGTGKGPLDIPEDVAHDLVCAVQADDIDLAISYAMEVDHGTVQIWEEMFGSFTRFPIVPIFINSIAPPIPTYRRARMLGEAVGRFFAATDKRVLFVASGGLSHDPPIPEMATASPEIRAQLINNRNPSPEARAARQARVIAAGEALASGQSSRLPLAPEWDHKVLALLEAGDIRAFDAFAAPDIARTIGFASNETLCWIAAAAAQSVYGPAINKTEFYEAIPGWVAGMAMLTGTTRTNV